MEVVILKNLEKYGANENFFTQAVLYEDMSLARVVAQYKDLYRLVTESGEGLGEISGKLRHEAEYLAQYPAVGDFVMVDREDMQSGNAVIHKVLRRKSVFGRSAVGFKDEMQVVAANVDVLFICMALNSDYNLSRLERYLSVAWDSGALPVVVLTKSDLCADLPGVLLEISSVAIGVSVVALSAFEENSYAKLFAYLQPGVTAAFIGSSGVGKSTLVNLLAGEEILNTSGIRKDGKGRHTTTHRELFVLPQGGIVIDTPGMREFGVESVDLSRSFSDVDDLVTRCRFNDCTHVSEPGCAVLAALADGSLDVRRFDSYRKLQKEAAYDCLSAKQIETEKLNSMFASVGGMKKARDFIKLKSKRR